MHHYHSAGIQTFQHISHDKYACEGPYIPTWQEGAASWHPSILGHRLRGAHHAYFWLMIFADAVADIKAQLSHRVLDAVTKDVEHRLSKLHAPLGPARHASDFPDNAKCYTDYEPRPVREASLKDHVISGLTSESNPEGVSYVLLNFISFLLVNAIDSYGSKCNYYSSFRVL